MKKICILIVFLSLMFTGYVNIDSESIDCLQNAFHST
jgi:hypothetical protein